MTLSIFWFLSLLGIDDTVEVNRLYIVPSLSLKSKKYSSF